jgi:hypothetical protein
MQLNYQQASPRIVTLVAAVFFSSHVTEYALEIIAPCGMFNPVKRKPIT